MYNFSFYQFTTIDGTTRTRIVRDITQADGMRALVLRDHQSEATERARSWAASKGINVIINEPYPSSKYPGKVWLDLRIGGITL